MLREDHIGPAASADHQSLAIHLHLETLGEALLHAERGTCRNRPACSFVSALFRGPWDPYPQYARATTA